MRMSPMEVTEFKVAREKSAGEKLMDESDRFSRIRSTLIAYKRCRDNNYPILKIGQHYLIPMEVFDTCFNKD